MTTEHKSDAEVAEAYAELAALKGTYTGLYGAVEQLLCAISSWHKAGEHEHAENCCRRAAVHLDRLADLFSNEW